MPKLTKTLLDALPPKAESYLVFDSGVTGFAIRVMPSGTKTFQIQYRCGGRTRRMSLGSFGTQTVDEARKHAKTLLGAAARGEDPAEDRRLHRQAPTIAALCDRFMDEHVAVHCKATTARDYKSVLNKLIKPKIGTFRISDVRRADIAELHHAMRDRPYRANRLLAVLSKMFNLAELWGLREEGTNPCRLVPKFREQKRERFLTVEELIRLGDTLAEKEQQGIESKFVIAAYRLLILTGCRMREIQTLRWSYVTATHLVLPDSKTGARRIPLPPAASDILQGIPRDPENEFVIQGKFPGTHVTDLERPWRRIREAAGLENVRIHDLRHTYASHAVMNGTPLLTVGKILGHTQYQTTMRYAHLADSETQQAATTISQSLSATMKRPMREPNGLRLVK